MILQLKRILWVMSLTLSTICIGQNQNLYLYKDQMEEPEENLKSQNFVRGTMVSAFFSNTTGLSVEGRMGKKSSLIIGVGMGMGIGSYSEEVYTYHSTPIQSYYTTSTEINYSFILYPYVEIGQRNYYNFKKRQSNEKNVLNNSANYIGPKILILGPSIYSSSQAYYKLGGAYSTIGFVWGMQRVYTRNLYLNIELGLGYIIPFDQFNAPVVPIGGISTFKIGGMLSKAQKKL